MTTTPLEIYLARQMAYINDALDTRLPASSGEGSELTGAMRYAVLTQGKRLRPAFSLAIAELRGVPSIRVLDAACAVEMAHAASLILDDLPCMDNANTRRGQPCTHVRYGLATALLACVGLLAEAYRLVARNAADHARHRAADAVASLSEALGTAGLVMGQHLDLTLGDGAMSQSMVERVHHLKAGTLFVLAARLPAILLDFEPGEQRAVEDFARAVGLAFQIGDDVIDAQAGEGDAGHPNFADQADAASTRDRMDALILEAETALSCFSDRAERLMELAEYVRTRAR